MTKVILGKVALTLGGAWTEEESYTKLTYVTHRGDGWISAKDNIDVEPGSDALTWQKATDVQSFIEALERVTQAGGRLNEQIDEAEQLRVQAENARVEAERQRAGHEQTRSENESTRGNQEAARMQNERDRGTAEGARERAEQLRSQAEEQRQSLVEGAVRTSNNATRLCQQATQNSINAAQLAGEKAGLAEQRAEEARQAAASVDQKVRDAYELPVFSIDEETMELQAEEVPLADQFELENGNLTVDF